MEWQDLPESDNVEDRRGSSGRGIAIGGVGTVIVVIIALLLGKNPQQLLNQVQQSTTTQSQQRTSGPRADDSLAIFSRKILGSTEQVWTNMFQSMGRQYTDPTLVLFDGQTSSACGGADAATGPFYCPGDQKLYLDLSFFNELATRFHSPGNFASAYVIAHEVGHHIQNLLGISEKLDQVRGRVSEAAYNKLSVKLELQADFLAGVWAYHANEIKKVLQQGDLESALGAASEIGDDRLQKETQGYVVPDAFTHGTSAQRMYWFKKGFTTGDLKQGDTFSDPSLN